MHSWAFWVTGCEYSMCHFVDVCAPFTHVPFIAVVTNGLELIQSNANRIIKDKHPWGKKCLFSQLYILFPLPSKANNLWKSIKKEKQWLARIILLEQFNRQINSIQWLNFSYFFRMHISDRKLLTDTDSAVAPHLHPSMSSIASYLQKQ